MIKNNLFMSLLKLVGISFFMTIVWNMIFGLTLTPIDSEYNVEPFPGASFTFGVISAILAYVIYQFNVAKGLEQRIYANKSSINVIKVKNKELFDKANRLVAKHQVDEKESYIDIAKASGVRREEKTEISEKQKMIVDTKKETHVKTSEEFGKFIKDFPELTHNHNVQRLWDQMTDTETHLANSKIIYNQCVEQYNATIYQFPLSMLHKMLKLKPLEYYIEEDVITDEELGL